MSTRRQSTIRNEFQREILGVLSPADANSTNEENLQTPGGFSTDCSSDDIGYFTPKQFGDISRISDRQLDLSRDSIPEEDRENRMTLSPSKVEDMFAALNPADETEEKANRNRKTLSPSSIEGMLASIGNNSALKQNKENRKTLSPSSMSTLVAMNDANADSNKGEKRKNATTSSRRQTVSPGAALSLIQESMNLNDSFKKDAVRKGRKDTLSPEDLLSFIQSGMNNNDISIDNDFITSADSKPDSISETKRRNTLSPSQIHDLKALINDPNSLDALGVATTAVPSTRKKKEEVNVSKPKTRNRKTVSPEDFDMLLGNGEILTEVVTSTSDISRNAKKRVTASPSEMKELMGLGARGSFLDPEDEEDTTKKLNTKVKKRNLTASPGELQKLLGINNSKNDLQEEKQNELSPVEKQFKRRTLSPMDADRLEKLMFGSTNENNMAEPNLNITIPLNDESLELPTPQSNKKLPKPLKSCLSAKKKVMNTPSRNVVFGSPRGAEFHKTSPSTSMTPMCNAEAKEMFPLDETNVIDDEETSLNTSILEEAESLVDDSEKRQRNAVSSPAQTRRRRRSSIGPRRPSVGGGKRRRRHSLFSFENTNLDIPLNVGKDPSLCDETEESTASVDVSMSTESDDMELTGDYSHAIGKAIESLNSRNDTIASGLAELVEESEKTSSHAVHVIEENDHTVELGKLSDLVDEPDTFDTYTSISSVGDKEMDFGTGRDEMALEPIAEMTDEDISTSFSNQSISSNGVLNQSNLVCNLSSQFEDANVNITSTNDSESILSLSFISSTGDQSSCEKEPSAVASILMNRIRDKREKPSVPIEMPSLPEENVMMEEVVKHVVPQSFQEFVDILDLDVDSVIPQHTEDTEVIPEADDSNALLTYLIKVPYLESLKFGCDVVRGWEDDVISQMIDEVDRNNPPLFSLLSEHGNLTNNLHLVLEAEKISVMGEWYHWRNQLENSVYNELKTNQLKLTEDIEVLSKTKQDIMTQAEKLITEIAALDELVASERQMHSLLQAIDEQDQAQNEFQEKIQVMEKEVERIESETQEIIQQTKDLKTAEECEVLTAQQVQSICKNNSFLVESYRIHQSTKLINFNCLSSKKIECHFIHPNQTKTSWSLECSSDEPKFNAWCSRAGKLTTDLKSSLLSGIDNYLFDVSVLTKEEIKPYKMNQISNSIRKMELLFGRRNELYREIQELITQFHIEFSQESNILSIVFSSLDADFRFVVGLNISPDYPTVEIEPLVDIIYGEVNAQHVVECIKNTPKGYHYIWRICNNLKNGFF